MKLLINHKTKDFCESRRALLDNYLKTLLTIKELSASTIVIAFLSRSDEYLSEEKVSQEEKEQYERTEEENTFVTGEEDEITDSILTTDNDDEISVSINSVQLVRKEYVLYAVRVNSICKETDHVMRRYNEFKEYDTALRVDLRDKKPGLVVRIPQLPMKEPKLIRDHFHEDFVERRRILLESYLKRLVKVEALRTHPLTIKFLGLPV